MLRGIGASGRVARRLSAIACLTAASIAATASPAGATMLIGQTAPGSQPGLTCSAASADQLQPTSVTTAAYFAKEAGTITAWSTNAALGPGQTWVVKVFRRVSDPLTYKVVGHDGPRTLAPGVMNTFTGVNVAVQPGDILGFNSSGAASACTFVFFGDQFLTRSGNLSDGSTGAFSPVNNLRLNISAVLTPSNSFTVGGISKNKTNGTATMTINVSNPGLTTVAGKGISAPGGPKESTQAGPVQVKIKTKGKSRRALARSGSVKVRPKITFAPFNGDPTTGSVQVKLKDRR
jgi:hypothetical protein